MYALLRGMMRLVVHVYLGGRFQVAGQAGVPRREGLVVCANHASTVDPPLVPAFLPRADSWSMAKSEYFARPGPVRWLFRAYHAFPVVRHSPDRGALKHATEILHRGQALILYPEGTRVEEGGLARAEPGAGFIARTSGAAVQPIGLVGTRSCFPKGSRWPRRVAVEVRYGRPFQVLARRADGLRVGNQEAADAIMLAIAELLPAEMRGHYADMAGLRRRLAGITRPL